jgi:asparagine synthase (glutamine-hydrolysing)
VRVPFCDHRLVEYVWNVPWKLKTPGGVEKGLLRQAVADLLPTPVLERRKSIYPGPADTHYEQAITSQLAALLAQPDAPLFALIDHAALATAFGNDPRLPGLMPVQPGPTAPASYLLEANTWLAEYGVAPA